jgi:hypothetical protein
MQPLSLVLVVVVSRPVVPIRCRDQLHHRRYERHGKDSKLHLVDCEVIILLNVIDWGKVVVGSCRVVWLLSPRIMEDPWH